MAEFKEFKAREGWWFLTYLLLARAKCELTEKAYKETQEEFVEYLADYLPLVLRLGGKK